MFILHDLLWGMILKLRNVFLGDQSIRVCVLDDYLPITVCRPERNPKILRQNPKTHPVNAYQHTPSLKGHDDGSPPPRLPHLFRRYRSAGRVVASILLVFFPFCVINAPQPRVILYICDPPRPDGPLATRPPNTVFFRLFSVSLHFCPPNVYKCLFAPADIRPFYIRL